jgi:hypothetical protein
MRRTAAIAGAAMIGGIVALGVLWWYFDWGHERVEKLPHLHGKPLEVVIASLGEPDQLDYTMADSPDGEFRVELYNTYPPGDPKAAQARIKELQWHWARYHIAVWMHEVNGEWVVLDTCRWKEAALSDKT